MPRRMFRLLCSRSSGGPRSRVRRSRSNSKLCPVGPANQLVIASQYLAEYGVSQDRDTAWVSTKGTLKGFGIAAVIQVAAVLVIGLLWLVWTFIAFTI